MIQQAIDSSTLSWGTRVKGFIACFAIGVIFSILGSVCLFFGGHITFAVFYTLGNIIALTR
jgi:Got1/Sft2-like family